MQNFQIKFLKVVQSSDLGFLLQNEEETILLPKSEQKEKLFIGKEVLVAIIFDQDHNEYFASQKIDDFLMDNAEENDLFEGETTEGIVYRFTPLGAKVAVKSKYSGLIYDQETFVDVQIGQKIKVFIKKIREDGRIDLGVHKGGYRNFIDESRKIIIDKLTNSNGLLPFTDKSSPEDIYENFGISKKRFKESLGALYKEKRIKIGEDGIYLLDNQQNS